MNEKFSNSWIDFKYNFRKFMLLCYHPKILLRTTQIVIMENNYINKVLLGFLFFIYFYITFERYYYFYFFY
jgi:hypothetical protein